MKKCVFYFITYFVVCFGGLGSLYRLVSLLMGESAGLGSLYRLVSLLMGESAFAWMPRMFEYHEQHPMSDARLAGARAEAEYPQKRSRPHVAMFLQSGI